MLKVLLFDLDGTLANTDPLHFLTWQKMLAPLGLEIDRGFYQRKISGRLNEKIVKDILPQLSLKEGLEFAAKKEAMFREIAQNLQPLPGVKTVLDWAQEQNLKLAVVSNAPRANLEFMLDILKLNKYFPIKIISDDLGIGKPDPTPYLSALEQFKVNAENAIAFEDSPSGIRAAVGAKIYTIGISSTHDPQTLKELGAKLVIPDFTATELWDFLSFWG